MKLIAAALTDRGKVRRDNQDSYRCDVDAGLFLIADGMGGRAGGKRASDEAARVVATEVGGQGPSALDLGGRLAAAIEHANASVWRLAQDDATLHGMGTTVAALVIENGVAYLAHVGDSRVYRVRQGAVEALTRDHSYAAELEAQGVEVSDPKLRARYDSMLTRAVGVDDRVEVESGRHPVLPEDTFVLCSDGVYRTATPADLGALVAAHRDDPAAACAAIIAHANAAGGPDNSTVIVVRAVDDGAPA